MICTMTLTSFANGLINGKWSLILTPISRQLKFLFSCKKSSPNHLELIFNGTAVTKANEQKHLGLILDSTLSFEKHLNEKIMKAKKMLEYSNSSRNCFYP